ncbi:collagen alpha-1(I) chain-like [Pezoporus occidentalis]|uniref:collagen alpha-1(I) chain-like n=1 Tax=Pezoporus occidentalis TaxID=407982 RepID=UPI002F9091DD
MGMSPQQPAAGTDNPGQQQDLQRHGKGAAGSGAGSLRRCEARRAAPEPPEPSPRAAAHTALGLPLSDQTAATLPRHPEPRAPTSGWTGALGPCGQSPLLCRSRSRQPPAPTWGAGCSGALPRGAEPGPRGPGPPSAPSTAPESPAAPLPRRQIPGLVPPERDEEEAAPGQALQGSGTAAAEGTQAAPPPPPAAPQTARCRSHPAHAGQRPAGIPPGTDGHRSPAAARGRGPRSRRPPADRRGDGCLRGRPGQAGPRARRDEAWSLLARGGGSGRSLRQTQRALPAPAPPHRGAASRPGPVAPPGSRPAGAAAAVKPPAPAGRAVPRPRPRALTARPARSRPAGGRARLSAAPRHSAGRPERPPRSRARPRQGRPGRPAGPLVYAEQLSAPPAAPPRPAPLRSTPLRSARHCPAPAPLGPARRGAARPPLRRAPPDAVTAAARPPPPPRGTARTGAARPAAGRPTLSRHRHLRSPVGPPMPRSERPGSAPGAARAPAGPGSGQGARAPAKTGARSRPASRAGAAHSGGLCGAGHELTQTGPFQPRGSALLARADGITRCKRGPGPAEQVPWNQRHEQNPSARFQERDSHKEKRHKHPQLRHFCDLIYIPRCGSCSGTWQRRCAGERDSYHVPRYLIRGASGLPRRGTSFLSVEEVAQDGSRGGGALGLSSQEAPSVRVGAGAGAAPAGPREASRPPSADACGRKTPLAAELPQPLPFRARGHCRDLTAATGKRRGGPSPAARPEAPVHQKQRRLSVPAAPGAALGLGGAGPERWSSAPPPAPRESR